MEDTTNKHPESSISNHHTPTTSSLHVDQERLIEDRTTLLNLASQVKKLIKHEKARDQKIIKMQSTIDTLKGKIARMETESSGGLVDIEKVKEQDDSSEGELSAISTQTKVVLDLMFPCLPVSNGEPICHYPDTAARSQIIENASLRDARGAGASTRHTLDHDANPFPHTATGTETVIGRERRRAKSPDRTV